MKRLLYGIILLSFLHLSCSLGEQSRITFKNKAQGGLTVNFRGEAINVSSGKTVELKNIPSGTYTYETTFELPFGANSGTTQGDVSGEVNIFPGTKILVLYSSTLIDSAYILYGSMTTSDDLNQGTTTP